MIETSTNSRQTPHYRIESDHSEQLINVISAFTVDPMKNLLYYFIPWMGAYVSNQLKIRLNDKVQLSLLPEVAKKEIIQKIDALRSAAGISRKVDIYTSLNSQCSSFGG